MRVRAHQHRCPPVGKMAKRHFLGCGLAMGIHKDEIGITAQPAAHQRPVKRRKDRVIRCHEQIGHDIDHCQPRASIIGDMHHPLAGCALCHVQRPQQARLLFDVIDDLALVPDMVARGQHIDPRGKQIIADLRRHAETAGRVLAIDHQKIQLQFSPQRGSGFDHRVTRRAPDNVTQKQNPHYRISISRRPVGVSTPSSGMS